MQSCLLSFGAREIGLLPGTTLVESPQSNSRAAEAFVRTMKCDYSWASSIPDAEAVLRQPPVSGWLTTTRFTHIRR